MPAQRITTLLRHSVYTDLDEAARGRFVEMVDQITDWDELVNQAESNALSNLLYSHCLACDVDVPESEQITFKALTARHQRNNRERTGALQEILEKLNSVGIEAILLKGMALIHTLYRDKYQRPMGDIDILVKAERAGEAQQCLRDLGYHAQDRQQGFLLDHHHLPIASKKQNGMSIQVEIHHNALSRDATSSMDFYEVFENCQTIDVLGQQGYALGHKDMITHLCHHTFEPIESIKLGAIADIYGYASRYHDEISWDELKRNSSIIINTLRCLHFLTPLPTVLAGTLGAPTVEPPSGVGFGFHPLSTTMGSRISTKEKFKRLFLCSDWWRHIYYEIPPEKGLLWNKLVRHPAKIGFWIYRRIVAQLKSKFI